VLINGSLKAGSRYRSLTCKIMLELLLRRVYFEELNPTLIILLKQALGLEMEELMFTLL
jgi:hypothetical protein